MQRLRIWIRNIFGFSQSETNGFLILLPAMLLILFSYPVYRTLFHPPAVSIDPEQVKIDSLLAQWNFNPVPDSEGNTINLFTFDPNTATSADFDSLGMPSYLSNRIMNYRSKGGYFRKPEDLSKIYGMDTAFFERLYPFINIRPKALKPSEHIYSLKSKNKNTSPIEPQDLNLADTAQLKLIKGIGTVLALRIVKYRNALGGFIDQNQITEVYGLDTAVVERVKTKFYVSPSYSPIQLNINTATESDLSNHPYIRSKIAKLIVAYRFQHGSFNEIADLLKIDLIDQTVFDRISPYLTIE